jgi:hypothetical protein
MKILTALFGITEHSLSIYDTKLSRKYLDRVLLLKKIYYQEQNKDEEKRNHALLDNVVNELCIITETIAQFGKPSIKN